jgi:Zn-dependent protease with chaperone function
MALKGLWFDGKVSASISAELQVDDAGFISVIDEVSRDVIVQIPFSAVRISSRVGNTPRYVYFPDSKKFETRQHDLVDQLLQKYRPSFWNNLAHQLETHTYFVALTLVLVVSFAWVMVVYGLPATSRYIAYQLPKGLMNRAATETLQLLDATHLKPTRLDETRQAELLQHFSPAIAQNEDLNIRVIFRHGGAIGANAFALPDGTILFTDQIVQLAKNDDELLAVLAHEIGHVKYRHALRSVIQGSVISFAVAMVTGDLSAASNLLATLPIVMSNMSYSRNFEREADDNSLLFLDTNHIERHHFVDLMDRLTYQAQCSQLLAQDDLKNKISTAINDEQADVDDEIGEDDFDRSTLEHDGLDGSENESEEVDNTDDIITSVDVEANRLRCDKLIADYKDDFFHSTLLGYFASHPETDERTKKFKPKAEADK